MDELLGLYAELFAAGRRWRIAPLRVADLWDVERRVAARLVGTPGDASASAGPRRVALGQVARWLRTPEGAHYALWLRLRQLQPETSEQDATDLLTAVADSVTLRGPDLGPLSAEGLAWERPIPWRQLLTDLGRAYGWPPREVAELTLDQLAAYVAALDRPTGPRFVTPAQARARRRRTLRRWPPIDSQGGDCCAEPQCRGDRHAG
jgi:hypothetical protein